MDVMYLVKNYDWLVILQSTWRCCDLQWLRAAVAVFWMFNLKTISQVFCYFVVLLNGAVKQAANGPIQMTGCCNRLYAFCILMEDAIASQLIQQSSSSSCTENFFLGLRNFPSIIITFILQVFFYSTQLLCLSIPHFFSSHFSFHSFFLQMFMFLLCWTTTFWFISSLLCEHLLCNDN